MALRRGLPLGRGRRGSECRDDPRSRCRAGLDAQDAIVAIDHFLDDRKSESRAVSWSPFHPIKTLEHLASRIFGNASTVVLDAQVRAAAVIRARMNRHRTAGRRIAQRVVDQIVQQLGQQQRIARNNRAFEDKPKVDIARDRARHPFLRRGVGDLAQVEILGIAAIGAAGLGPCESEQLRRQMACPHRCHMHALDLSPHVWSQVASQQ
jgi:hypothetical protein